MEITQELLEMLNDVTTKDGRYVITEGMNPNLKTICEKTNIWKDNREKILLERRRIKHSMGL